MLTANIVLSITVLLLLILIVATSYYCGELQKKSNKQEERIKYLETLYLLENDEQLYTIRKVEN